MEPVDVRDPVEGQLQGPAEGRRGLLLAARLEPAVRVGQLSGVCRDEMAGYQAPSELSGGRLAEQVCLEPTVLDVLRADTQDPRGDDRPVGAGHPGDRASGDICQEFIGDLWCWHDTAPLLRQELGPYGQTEVRESPELLL